MEAKDVEILRDQIARHEYAQNLPWAQLNRLSSAIMGVNTGGTVQTVKPEMPLGQRILGGGAAGAGMGSLVGGPAGGLIGALGGGLLGGFA